jgi:hypothetical protein
MSGGITISDKKHWEASGWCYGAVADAVISILAETQKCPTLLHYLNDLGSAPQVVAYIDLKSRPPEEVQAFREAAVLAIERFKQDPRRSQNFLNHCQKLIAQFDDKHDSPVA